MQVLPCWEVFFLNLTLKFHAKYSETEVEELPLYTYGLIYLSLTTFFLQAALRDHKR